MGENRKEFGMRGWLKMACLAIERRSRRRRRKEVVVRRRGVVRCMLNFVVSVP